VKMVLSLPNKEKETIYSSEFTIE